MPGGWCKPEHPVYVTERSDAQPRPKPQGHEDLNTNWVGAGHLKIGDKIKQADGTVGVVANVATVQQTQEMFNLTVDEAHTFYVGQNGWLVHNGGWCPDAAEIFARGKGNLPGEFYGNMYNKVESGMLREADDFVKADGTVLTAHPNRHAVPKADQVDTLNNWDNFFTGMSYNGRPVDIYLQGDRVVVTAFGDKTQIITSYTGVNITRWTSSPKPGEFWWRFQRNTQR